MEGESADDSAPSHPASGASDNNNNPAVAAEARWTCEACGCHTNTETDTSCTICGTSQSGGSFLRRASHARAAWMARGLLGRPPREGGSDAGDPAERHHAEDLLEEDAELWDTVVREVELERQAMGRSLEAAWRSTEVSAAGGVGLAAAGLGSARSIPSAANRRRSRPDAATATAPQASPEELWAAAVARDYSPRWTPTMSATTTTPATTTTTTITTTAAATTDGATATSTPARPTFPQLATIPAGAVEGKALRAEPPLPREGAIGAANRGSDQRMVGFRVAFDHPTATRPGQSMGGCYMVGVTTSSFTSWNEANGLANTPFFWGIEDGGSKYEGPRHAAAAARRSGQQHRHRLSGMGATYGSELGPSERSLRNEEGVLFGAQDVVTVVADLQSRTLSFWRNDVYLGPLVQGLPRGGSLYPVVVPFNARVSVAICPLSEDPLPLLRNFSADYRQQKETDEAKVRQVLAEERALFWDADGKCLTPVLQQLVGAVFRLYTATEVEDGQVVLERGQAARLWYRCGLSLQSLQDLLVSNNNNNNNKPEEGTSLIFPGLLSLTDWQDVVTKVLAEDAASTAAPSTKVEEGDRVQLTTAYEKYGDAAGGPLRPGDRGVVVELQGPPNAESRSVRVMFNGRRWWYQPQAILSERSKLISSAGVWFVQTLLRVHGYHPTTMAPLRGQSVASISPQVGDVVVPKPLSATKSAANPMEGIVGRVVLDQAGIGKDLVSLESIHPKFTGAGSGNEEDAFPSKVTLTTRAMAKDKLEYSTVFHGSGGDKLQGDCTPDPVGMKVEDLLEVKTDGDTEQISSKVLSDLAGVARLDGSALESLTKECKKNSEALANVFTAGLPDALLKATETAERQMRSLEPREDLPERISAVGSLALYIAEQVFSDKPKTVASDTPPSPDDSPPPLQDRNRSTASLRASARGIATSRRARNVAAALEEGSNAAGLVASLQQRRGLLLSLMSRSRGDGAGIEEPLNPLADDLFFGSRLPPSPPPVYFSAGDRGLLAGNPRDTSGRSPWYESVPQARSNSRPSNDRNNSDQASSAMESDSRQSRGSKTYLESLLRSYTTGSKATVPSSVPFFHHLVRVGLWSDSTAWVKAAVEKHIRKSSQKTSSVLKQAYDEEGTPILKLAVTFGCSSDMVGLLLACGAHVTAADVRLAIETDQAAVLSLFLRHASLPTDLDMSKYSNEITYVMEQARERQDRLDRMMRESAGEFMVEMLKRMVDLGLISRRHRTARLDSCSRSISEILVGNVLLRALQQSQSTEKKPEEADPNDESMTGRYTVDDRLESHPACGLFGSLPEEILGNALFGTRELATTTLLLLEDFLCSKDMIDAAAGLTALFSLLVKFSSLQACSELMRYGMLELVSFHDALASSRCADVLSTKMSTRSDLLPPSSPGCEGVQFDPTDEASSGMVTCPKDHPAVLHITRHSSFRCDLCGNGVERGRVMHGCRECDWDACEECTDKAESGLVKCAAIREIANDCRKILETDSGSNASGKPPEDGKKYLSVIAEIGQQAEWTDVENISVRLLRQDHKAIRDLAQMLRIPGRITIHQFQNLILPALHVACVGREEYGPSAGGGHRSKKARVASQSFEKEDRRNAWKPEERTGFCMELVRAMILDVDETPRSAVVAKLAESENSEEQESEGDDGGTESDNEKRQVVNEREIKFFAEASELLRRLQQVLSLYENVSISRVIGSKKASSPGDLQSLTKPIELHLAPSTFRETSPSALAKLVVHAEPLVAVEDLKRHILRCCSTVDPPYKAYCRRLVSDRAVIVERPHGSIASWSFAEIVDFDETSGAHHVRFGRKFLPGMENRDLPEDNPTDLCSLVAFDAEEVKIVLAVREFYVLKRMLTGKKQSLPEEKAPTSNLAPEVGTRVQSSEDGGSSFKTFTIVASSNQEDKELFTLVGDDGAVSTVQAEAIRFPERSSDGDETSAARWMARGRRSSGSETLNRVFPFLLTRRRGDSEEGDESSDSTLMLKRSFSALSLVDALRPTDLIPSEMARGAVQKLTREREVLLHCEISGRHLALRFAEDGIEKCPSIDVKFNIQEKLPGVEMNQPDATLISSLHILYNKRGTCADICVSRPVRLFFSISTQSEGKMTAAEKFTPTHPKIAALPASPPSPVPMEVDTTTSWLPESRSRARKLSSHSVSSDDQELTPGLCDGLDAICIQSMEVISALSEFTGESRILRDRERTGSVFANAALSKKLKDQLDDALSVVGGALPEWCIAAPSFAPRVFSYDSRRALLERSAFGVSRSIFKQQEAKVNIGRLRQRMSSLRARAVELVGEAFSGGAEDPTALQLQADELYGMEEALATRVRGAFRAVKWKEHALEVAKAVIRRGHLLADADTTMSRYACDSKVKRRRLEVRFDGESGFDAASGDEAGVTRGFYADVAEALLSSDHVANVFCSTVCSADTQSASLIKTDVMELDDAQKEATKLPLWIPDMDSSGQVVIPTPRADERSGLGVYPRPIPKYHPQMDEIVDKFRSMGRLFAAAVRDGFMFPLPLSASFLKLVQRGQMDTEDKDAWEELMDMSDLPRAGFLGGEIYAAHVYTCRALDELDAQDPPLSRHELQRKYDEVARDQNFARVALGKSYECSFEDYFQDRTFVDPLDPAQDEKAHPLCTKGYKEPVTVYNVRKWVTLAKRFFLYDGVIAQAVAFRRGIEDFFSADYLCLFTAEELQRDVCGAGDNVEGWDEAAVRKIFKLDGGKDAAEALVAVAAMGGEGGAALSRRFGPSSPTISHLVKALLDATAQQRRQFLSFVTSVPIVTPGRIEVVPIVSPSGDFLPMRDPSCLPRANTCSRRLYLPKFDEYETFCTVLWAVVREESKFKGFYEWRGS